jgi:PAS domain S-box-containing protein
LQQKIGLNFMGWLCIAGVGLLVVLVFFLLVTLYNNKQRNKQAEQEYRDRLRELDDKYKAELSGWEEKFREAEKLARVAKQSQNAIMLMDADGNILWVNESFTRLYEYTYDEFVRALGDNIRKTSFNPMIHERLNRCLNHKEAVTYEALNITKTGKEIWTHTSLIPLQENNEVVGLATVDSDVHNRIKASEDMARFIVLFNEKIGRLSNQLDVMVELTDALFGRIEISQRRMNRTEEILMLNRDISNKLKILGLNASIEAHVAGKNGSGFRVISNEIVAVSNTMLNSLKEINELVSSVKRSSEKLGLERERSEEAITRHKHLISELKQEINSMECAVMQIKLSAAPVTNHL